MMPLRRALLLVVAAGMVTGLGAGLARAGLGLPLVGSRAMEHGPLMVLGVFGTVIALERAVAMGTGAALVAPALGAMTATLLLLRHAAAPWTAVLLCAAMLLMNAVIARRHNENFTRLMAVGSLVLGAGTLAWASGATVMQVLPSWMAFFTVTIVAERMELSRLVRMPGFARRSIEGIVVLHAAAGALATHDAFRAGALFVFGVTTALLGAWLLAFDASRRTVRTTGLARFTAIGVRLGAAWLLVAGAGITWSGLPGAGLVHDAIVHAVLVGFVMSMVFAHAPIILPAVAGVRLPHHPAHLVPLALLHGAVLVRIIGAVVRDGTLRQASGVLTVTAMVLFVGVTLVSSSARAGRGRAAPAVAAPAKT